MEQAQDSSTTGIKQDNSGQMAEALESQEAKAPITDCRKCGGRGYIVQPGIRGNWSMPCPACGPYAA